VAFAWQNPTQNPPGGGGSFVIESGAPVNTIYIKADGKVGIGTSTPGAKLDVVGGMIKIPKATDTDNGSPGLVYVANDDFLFNGSYINHYGFGFHSPDSGTPGYTGAYMSGYYGLDLFTGGQSRVHVLQNGNIGIGTISPVQLLEVSGTNGKGISLTNTSGYGNTSNIDFYGFNNTSLIRRFASIQGLVTGEDTQNGDIGAILFSTKPLLGDTSLTERMRITSGGNVNIGTTAPFIGQLNVNKANVGALGGDLWITNAAANTTGNSARLSFGLDNTTDTTSNAYIHALLTNSSVYLKDLAFGTYGGGSLSERMRITSEGNVGIGTVSPGAKLNVAGGDIKMGDASNPRGLNILQHYLSLGETESGASTILGNNIKVTDGVDETVQVSASAADGPTYLRLNYSNGITFHRIAPAAVGTQYASSTGELMRITTAGNLGIGTTVPAAKLAINGGLHVGGDSDPGDNNALIDGTLTVTGNSNTCNMVSYTGGGGTTQCPAGFYTWSGVALTSGYMLCCKVSNPI